MSTVNYSAQCHCGQQSIQITQPPMAQLVCHCEDCRKVSGNDFTHVVFFMPGACQVQGEFKQNDMPGGSGQPKTYFSCPHCGVFLYATISVLKGQIGIEAARMDKPFKFEPRFHVWTSEKAKGVEIAANAMQFTKGPPKPPHLV